MKNILLGTSALFGAAVLATGALAEDPKVMIGGVIDAQAGIVNEDRDAGLRNEAFRSDTEINVSVAGKSENGLGYGAVIDLEADTSNDAFGQGANASRTYVYLDGAFGRTELGSVEGSAHTTQVTAANIARATGGINGDWNFFNSHPTGADVNFLTVAALPTYHGSTAVSGGDLITANANKFNYYTPRFSGFQLGLSYTPDAGVRGQGLNTTGTNVIRNEANGNYENIVDLGVSYQGELSGVNVNAAVGGQSGESENAALQDLQAYNAGLVLGYHGFSIAGSYADWSDSGRANNQDQDLYTLGAAYDFGPFGASVTYLNSSVETGATTENEFDNIVLGADYKLAPGLTPYVEASFFDFDGGLGTTDNEGSVVIVGTNLSF